MSERRILTDAEVRWLRKAWNDAGLLTPQIRAHLRIGSETLRRVCAELGLGPRGFVWTPETMAEALRLSAEGLRPREIADRLGATRNAVYGVLRRRGAVGGVLLQPSVCDVTPEYEAMLRRVAQWDAAARNGLAALERQRSAR